ncbi:hypothetical protein B5X24_HaOG211717 [Helicoverpa armigera]|nr:hypothetical protein B5X24_HaOG211717 [Helicoverpa armigera]
MSQRTLMQNQNKKSFIQITSWMHSWRYIQEWATLSDLWQKERCDIGVSSSFNYPRFYPLFLTDIPLL